MFRSDIEQYGTVRRETYAQAFNEELTFVAEGLDAPLQTRFTLYNSELGLVDERGTPLQEALKRGEWAAEQAYQRDSRLGFNLSRAIHDFHEGQLVQQMADSPYGETTIVSVSPFCEEAYAKLGGKMVENLGFRPDRLMAFVRIFNKLPDGNVEVLSISVDNSNLEAFRGVLGSLGVDVPADTLSDDFLGYRAHLSINHHEQKILPAAVIETYDSMMQSIYKKDFRAGRQAGEEREAWQFITEQKDLVEHYFDRLEEIARQSPDDLEQKRKLTYSFWAALKARMSSAEKQRTVMYAAQNVVAQNPNIQKHMLNQEMNRAFVNASAKHEKMVGCGGSISFGRNKDLLKESPENAFSSIFGGEDDEGEAKSSWVWKRGICRVDDCPTRPGSTQVGPCSVCRGCQHLFDKGQDPGKTYKKQPKNKV